MIRKSKKLVEYKTIFIAIFIVGLAAALIYLINKNPKEPITLEIEDRCGQAPGNLVTHTVTDEHQCSQRCRAQCISQDYELDSFSFAKTPGPCYSCSCDCK